MNAIFGKLGWILLLAPWASVQAADPAPAENVPAQSAAVNLLEARDGWIRTAPPQAPVRAGYVSLHNPGTQEVVIDAVRSDAFGAIEIHEMHDVDGVMRMRRVSSLTLAPRQSVELAPGGLHLMLFRPSGALHEGDQARFVFSGPQGDVLEADLVVRQP